MRTRTRRSKSDLPRPADDSSSNCPDRASAQSPLRAAPCARVATSLAGQLVTVMRSPCFRGARHAQREAKPTRRFHIVRRLAASVASGSREFRPRLASGIAPAGHRRRDKRGRHHRAGKRQEFNAHHRSVNSSACCFLSKGPQIQRSQWHRASQPPPGSDDCASRRAFRPFQFRARASILTTVAFCDCQPSRLKRCPAALLPSRKPT